MWRAQNTPGTLIDPDGPNVHCSTAIADEIQMLSVRRPHRIPVQVNIVRDGHRAASCGRYGPDISFPAVCRPIRNAKAMRRPVWLNGVSLGNEARLSCFHFDSPECAGTGPVIWIINDSL